ncbi:adenylate/guanylate cyclase domain-containing protein [Pelagibacterium mangrovi]|uniref:adenylate/guanylate cyclase domain-containing protein n=1 Tax=Pelagibacterium mangrovi TaxID=3119828 RepID=UPI002FC8C37F
MGNWKYDRAKKAIDKRIEDVSDVVIVDYTRDMSLDSIPTNKAYRMDAVHLYADITNLDDILENTGHEGERCHKRTLRFLNQHYRAADRILSRCNARRVDFHNQRLHSVISKPYGEDSETDRINRAVAIAQLIIDVLAETGNDDKSIPNAQVRVGIDTGRALVVNNGRSGNREPLFLGKPANCAAKFASSGGGVGIYLTNDARRAIGLEELAEDKDRTTKLTRAEVEQCQSDADLGVTKETIVQEWRDDLEKHPIGKFEFTRSTPPLKNLDILALSPSNSRRMELVSVYADIDEFTQYVDDHIDDDPEDVVRCLHVIRSELDRVISSDFDGRRIRFVGDCIHGLLLEGTSQTTDGEKTISTATLCAGALRSSFNLALERLEANGVDIDDLGLAIGFDFGPTPISRLGMRGDKVRCSISRGVLSSEDEQKRCNGNQTAIGETAYDEGTSAVRSLFGAGRRLSNLTYDIALDSLIADGDKTAKAAASTAFITSSPAMAKAVEEPFRPYSKDA